jgi:hypothetical protein
MTNVYQAEKSSNRIVNHWATYLVIDEKHSFRLYMTPGGVYDKDGCHLGVLLVAELNYKYSGNYSKVVELELSRPVVCAVGPSELYFQHAR